MDPSGSKKQLGFWTVLRDVFSAPMYAYPIIGALIAGGLALVVGPSSESAQSSLAGQGGTATPFTITGALAIGLAFLWWGSRWKDAGWRWWGVAVGLVLIGGLFIGSAFTVDCDCRSLVWFGAPMTLLGVVALGGRLTSN